MVTKVKRLAMLVLSFVIMSMSQPVLSLPPEEHIQNGRHIQNEQQWIVDSIGNDITGMIAFAAQKSAVEKPDLKTLLCTTGESATNGSDSALSFNYALSYQGAVKPISTKIELSRYIWNPGNYAPWASALLARFHLTETPASDSSSTQASSLIKELSNYSPDLLIQKNKDISSALSASPLDPQLHEEAALLCATLAFRECTATFNDLRPELNRLVAHLAVARALRGSEEFGDAGKLSEIILCCLSGREVESLDLMKPLNARTTDDALQSWMRAVRVRSTHDFRIADAKNGSMIERLEYGRAISEELNCDALTDYLAESHESGSLIDWSRIAIRGGNTVESGHLYLEPSVEAEQSLFLHDYALMHDGAKIGTADAAVQQLNLLPTGCLVSDPQWQLQAISWPNMAASHSRHLLDSIYSRYIFERDLWGVPDQAQQNLEDAERNYSKLNLFPVCQLNMVRGKANSQTAEQRHGNDYLTDVIARLISQHPDWFTFELWNIVKVGLTSPPPIPKPTDSWFKPLFLMGTGFDYEWRRHAPEVSIKQLEELRALAPHSKYVLFDLANKKYKNPTGDQFMEMVGAFGEYDLHVMRIVAEADKNDKVKYISRLEAIAKFQPDGYFDLAHALEDSDPERAVKVYEQGMNLSRDAVLKSSRGYWLVSYYYDHGEKDKAMAIATEGATVYSLAGLGTLAWLYERMGQLDVAEGIYKQVEDRYSTEKSEKYWARFAFYVRNQDKKPEYKRAIEEASKTFAHGWVKLKKEDLEGPPSYGGKVYEASALAKSYGINDGCIVVAVDGYRVANIADLLRARAIDYTKKTVEVVFWDGKQYHTVNAAPPDKKYGFQLHEWNAK